MTLEAFCLSIFRVIAVEFHIDSRSGAMVAKKRYHIPEQGTYYASGYDGCFSANLAVGFMSWITWLKLPPRPMNRVLNHGMDIAPLPWGLVVLVSVSCLRHWHEKDKLVAMVSDADQGPWNFNNLLHHTSMIQSLTYLYVFIYLNIMIHVYQINGHDILWCHVNMVSKLQQQLKASAANPVASGLGWESPGPRWNMFSYTPAMTSQRFSVNTKCIKMIQNANIYIKSLHFHDMFYLIFPNQATCNLRPQFLSELWWDCSNAISWDEFQIGSMLQEHSSSGLIRV